MIPYINYTAYYDCQGLIDTTYQIDTERANEIRIINSSISGVFIVNNVVLYPFGAGKNEIVFSGNETEISLDKILVNTAWVVGNIQYSFTVIRKKFIDASVYKRSPQLHTGNSRAVGL